MVKDVFSGFPTGSKSVWPHLDYQGGDMQLGARSEESSLWVAYDFTKLTHEEKHCVDVFTDILGGHSQSHLMTELREKRGLVYNVSADIEVHVRRSLLRIYLQGPSAKFAEICDLAAQVILDIAANLNETDLSKSLRRYHISTTMGLDGLEHRVDDMITDISDQGWITDPAAAIKDIWP